MGVWLESIGVLALLGILYHKDRNFSDLVHGVFAALVALLLRRNR